MVTDAPVLTGESTILDALRILREENVRQIPVIDSYNRVLGVITQGRLMRAVFEEIFPGGGEGGGGGGGGGGSEGTGPSTDAGGVTLPRFIGRIDSISRASVSPALEKAFASVRPEASLFEVAGIFEKGGAIEGVLVVDNERRLLGVISHRDILRRLCEYLETRREKRR